MPQGSPFWQGVLLFAAALFLLWEAWRGWRNGVVRASINLVALIIASVIGFMAAQAAAAPAGGFSDLSGMITGALVGGGIGLVVLFIVWILGAVLFKRTEHQKAGLVRFFWGLGGAFFGVLMGLVFLSCAVFAIRGLGALAQARLETAAAAEPPPPVRTAAPRSPANAVPAAASAPVEKPSGLITGLVTLKESLELGPTGKVVEQVDPIPPDVYQLISDAAKVTSDQALMNRMIEYPGIQQMMQNPKIAALLSNPDILKAAEERNIMSMIGNKAMIAAVQDPEFSKELSKIDIRAALKFALEKPAPSPSPSPLPKKRK